jgi:hypothetical protein
MQIDGTWINQNRSTVEIHTDAAGCISGHYRSRKGRSAAGKAYPIVGQVSGDVLAFQVCWRDGDDDLQSITSFSGRLGRDASGAEVIHTVWVLVRQWENEERTRPTGLWNAFLTNSDVFHRQDGVD